MEKSTSPCFQVPENEHGQRLDRFLSDRLPQFSREKIKKALQKGQCTVDRVAVSVPKTKLFKGQTVVLQAPELHAETDGAPCLKAEEGAVNLLWHDEHVAVLNKPAGLTVHPCPSCPEGTLVHRLLGHFPQLLQQEGLRPGIVHRLDKDTSGLLLIALTEEARLRLSEAFAAREVHKEYLCLVHGVPAAEGEINAPLGRHPSVRVKMAVVPENQGGKEALTTWRTLYVDPAQRFSLLAVRIYTGRTHQIRVHMAHVGHPLWGDRVYARGAAEAARTAGTAKTAGAKSPKAGTQSAPSPWAFSPARQMLHAWQLSFPHPLHGETLHFACAPPPDFLDAIEGLSWHMQKVVITGVPASGKSALSQCLRECAPNIPVWSADAVVKEVYAPGADAWIFLRRRYGDRFIADDTAPVDRTALRQAMEDNPSVRREVEECTHGLAQHSLTEFWRHCAAQGLPLAVAEVPLYLEARWHKEDPNAPLLVGLDCPLPLRQERAQASRGWDPATLQTLESWQWPADRKLKACHYVVDNSHNLESLHHEAQKLLEHLSAVRQQHKAQCANIADVWKLESCRPTLDKGPLFCNK